MLSIWCMIDLNDIKILVVFIPGLWSIKLPNLKKSILKGAIVIQLRHNII